MRKRRRGTRRNQQRSPAVGILLLVLGLWMCVGLGAYLYLLRSGYSFDRIATEMGAAAAASLAQLLLSSFGYSAWLLPILFLIWGWNRLAGCDGSYAARQTIFVGFFVWFGALAAYSLMGGKTIVLVGSVGRDLIELGTQYVGRTWTVVFCGVLCVMSTFSLGGNRKKSRAISSRAAPLKLGPHPALGGKQPVPNRREALARSYEKTAQSGSRPPESDVASDGRRGDGTAAGMGVVLGKDSGDARRESWYHKRSKGRAPGKVEAATARRAVPGHLSQRLRLVFGVFLLVAAVWTGVSLTSQIELIGNAEGARPGVELAVGPLASRFGFVIVTSFGLFGFALPALFALWAFNRLSGKSLKEAYLKSIRFWALAWLTTAVVFAVVGSRARPLVGNATARLTDLAVENFGIVGTALGGLAIAISVALLLKTGEATAGGGGRSVALFRKCATALSSARTAASKSVSENRSRSAEHRSEIKEAREKRREKDRERKRERERGKREARERKRESELAARREREIQKTEAKEREREREQARKLERERETQRAREEKKQHREAARKMKLAKPAPSPERPKESKRSAAAASPAVLQSTEGGSSESPAPSTAEPARPSAPLAPSIAESIQLSAPPGSAESTRPSADAPVGSTAEPALPSSNVQARADVDRAPASPGASAVADGPEQAAGTTQRERPGLFLGATKEQKQTTSPARVQMERPTREKKERPWQTKKEKPSRAKKERPARAKKERPARATKKRPASAGKTAPAASPAAAARAAAGPVKAPMAHWKTGAVAVAAYVLAVGLTYTFVVKPVKLKLDSLRREKAIVQDFMIVTESRAAVSRFKDVLMRGDQRVSVLTDLKQFAKESGLTLIAEPELLPSAPITERVTEHPIEMRLRGTYHQMAEFVSRAEGPPRFLFTKGLDIGSDKDKGSVHETTVVFAALSWKS